MASFPISSNPFPLPPRLFAFTLAQPELAPVAEQVAARRVPSSWSRNTGGAGKEKGWQDCTAAGPSRDSGDLEQPPGKHQPAKTEQGGRNITEHKARRMRRKENERDT